MTCLVDIEGPSLEDLSARLVVLHSIRHHLNDLCDLRASTPIGKKIVDDFLYYAHAKPRRTLASPTTVDRTAWLADRWATEIRRAADVDDDDDRFQEHTQAVVTRVLQGLTGWQRSDEHVVCRWFHEIRRLTKEIYSDHRVMRSALEIAHILRHPGAGNPVPDPYGLTAETMHSAGGATIRLKFHLKDFGPETYAAVVRVLVHECVAHVPSGHVGRDDGHGPDAGVSNSSPFAEGLMDYAAEYFTERWADQIDEGIAAAVTRHGRGLATAVTSREPSGQARHIGHATGEHLVAFFMSMDKDRPTAQHLTVRLALQLNGSERALAEKDHLVSHLYPPFPPDVQHAILGWAAGTLDADGVLDAALRRTPADE
jgi:hypothetical protein